MRYLLFLILTACGTYTDPASERLTFYRCQGNREVAVRTAEDYDSVVVRYKQPPLVLYRYVNEFEDGYRSEDHIWRIKPEGGELIEINESGQPLILVRFCRPIR